VFHGRGVPEGLRDDRAAYAEFLKACPEETIIERQPVSYEMPAAARIRISVACPKCGELVMESRLQHLGEQPLCIPCSEL
jgi:formylmethanofuran dehydrogenase subunit E